MFQEINLSLALERNAGMLREVQAERLGRRLRANRGLWPGRRRSVEVFLPGGFAAQSASAGLASGEETVPKET